MKKMTEWRFNGTEGCMKKITWKPVALQPSLRVSLEGRVVHVIQKER